MQQQQQQNGRANELSSIGVNSDEANRQCNLYISMYKTISRAVATAIPEWCEEGRGGGEFYALRIKPNNIVYIITI